MDKYIGKLLDNRYEMLEILGVGGMAVVYKARDRVLDRYVAIKIMKDEFAHDEEFLRRFHNESQAVAKLSHNNIVSVYDVSQGTGVQYIVMELIEGITLKDYLRKKGKLSWQETLFFAQQISKALSHAHSRGVVHQDIKPHNIILLRDGTVKVTDFGIARFEKNQETRVIQEAIGSVHYISPEQAKGSRINHCADLYSLGIVMYECLTGHVPFDGDSPLAIVMQHMNAQAPLPSQVVPGIPRGMDDIVMRAMCPTLAKRYQSADEIYDDLERLKNNPRLRFSTAGADSRDPNQAATDETIAIPRVPHTPPRPQAETDGYRRSDPYRGDRDQVYRPKPSRPADSYDVEDEDDRPRRKKRKRSLGERIADSPAAMAGIAVAVFAVIAVGVAVFMLKAGGLFSEKLTIPNLVGMQLSDAQTQYGDNFIILEDGEEEDPNAEAGEILRQTPDGDTKASKGATIKVIVCGAPLEEDEDYRLPESLEGMNYQTAESMLSAQELKVRIERKDDLEVEKDLIIETDPAIGMPVKKGDTVTLYVSNGPDNVDVIVPQLIGKTLSEAEAELKENHLNLGTVTETDSDKPEGEVIDQSVEGGTTTKANSNIKLTVSNGKSQEPDEPVEPEPDSKPSDNNKPSASTQGTYVVYVRLPEDSETHQVSIDGQSGANKHSKAYSAADGNPVAITVTGEAGSSETLSIYVDGGTYSSEIARYE